MAKLSQEGHLVLLKEPTPFISPPQETDFPKGASHLQLPFHSVELLKGFSHDLAQQVVLLRVLFLVLEIDEGLERVDQVQVFDHTGHYHFFHNVRLDHIPIGRNE